MTSKYLQIAEYLEKKIISGNLKVSERLPSDEEIMKQFKVSRIVTTNAMRVLVMKGLVERIPGKGTFVISNETHEARQLSERHENKESSFWNIALVLPCIQDDYSVGLANKLVFYGYQKQMLISVFFSSNDVQMEDAVLRNIIASHYKGVILFPIDQVFYNDELLDAVRHQFPLVLLDRNLERMECSCIQSDNVMGARQAVSHLFELGHRRISFFSNSPLCVSSIADRMDGYLSQIGKYNLKIDPSLIITNSEKKNNEQLDRLIEAQLATALICNNSNDYEILLRHLFAANKKVPDDFSVITFDKPNSFKDGDVQINPTYIQQDVDKIAKKAVELMDSMIQSGKNVKTNISIPTKLVLGTSTKKI